MNRIANLRCRWHLRLVIVCFVLGFSMTTTIQGQVFDYRLEESPAISWNRLPLFDARAVAAGSISLMALPGFSAVFNPALIPAGPARVAVSLMGLSHQAFQFWGVNQGVVSEPQPLSRNDLQASGVAAAITLKKFRLAAGYSLRSILAFPDFEHRIDYSYNQFWAYQGTFSGKEESFFTALAWEPTNALVLGISLAYGWGRRDVELLDLDSSYYDINGEWVRKNITLRHAESHRSSHLIPGIGLMVRLSPSWIISAALNYPLSGHVDRTRQISFNNFSDGVSISQNQESRDDHRDPAFLSVATSYLITFSSDSQKEKHLRMAAEVKHTWWSSYRYEFFAESLSRNFSPTMEMAVGLEYGCGTPSQSYFLRLGFRRDPQPLPEVKTVLSIWSTGIGGHLGRFSGDLGLAYCSGSAGGVNQHHLLLVATVGFQLKGEQL